MLCVSCSKNFNIRFYGIGGTLYYARETNNVKKRVIVEEKEKRALLEECHNSCAHFGEKKSLKKLKRDSTGKAWYKMSKIG